MEKVVIIVMVIVFFVLVHFSDKKKKLPTTKAPIGGIARARKRNELID